MKKQTVAICLLVASANAGDISMPRYQKTIDVSAIRSKHLVAAVTDSATSLSSLQADSLPVIYYEERQLPVLPEVLELGKPEVLAADS